MNNKKFSFAAVISIIILLLYSYFVFMGIVYWKNGNFTYGIVSIAVLIAVVLFCVFVMCFSKATRFRDVGTTGQVIFGSIILIALIVSSMPFAHFLKLVSNQKEISAAFEQSYKYSTSINKAYEDYVAERKDKTREFLTTLPESDERYAAIFALPGSDDKASKIDRMINALEVATLPQSLRSANTQNTRSLEEGSKMTVWNLAMPGNIKNMDSIVHKSVEVYAQLSAKAHGYKGDNDYRAFSYAKFDNQINSLKSMLSTMSMPSVLSILAALVCFAFMLLPYYLTERDIASRSSEGRKRKNEKPAGPPRVNTPAGRKQLRSRMTERDQRNKK